MSRQPKKPTGTKPDTFALDEDAPKTNGARVIHTGLKFDEKRYQYDDAFVPSDPVTPQNVHTTMELMHLLQENKKIEIDARVMVANRRTLEYNFRRINGREKFIEAFKEAGPKWSRKFREGDGFGSDMSQAGSSVDQNDMIPILGGPFYKQLYQYDYLRMHNYCFFLKNHSPACKAAVEIITDFVLGRGFKVESEDPASQLMWDAFAEANDFTTKAKQIVNELITYGENMIWKLPNHATKITYQLSPGQKVPTGIIPRIRMIDPSCIWEIVTFPEDIERVIYYQWIAPTQYQTYTAPGVPTLKFIFTQVPADQVIHTKINAASNEKRGRSDLFASMGYAKRLDDAVNYGLISDMKRAAWSIDTEIRGSQADVDAYFAAQQALGTIPAAGSEFIHTEAVKRKYDSNPGASSQSSDSFIWALNMFCMGVRVPVSYMGTHLSGGQTKASALVSTEPVAKMFEGRQDLLKGVVIKLHKWVTGKTCDVLFPEIVSQDSAVRIRNIVVADGNEYISKERAASMVAKELNVTDFNYDKEKVQIEADIKAGLKPPVGPLTSPGSINSNPNASSKDGMANMTTTPVVPGATGVGGGEPPPPKASGVTGEDRANQTRSDRGY